MTQSSTSSLSTHVRRFLIADEDEDLHLTPALVETLISVLSKFTLLELLDLLLVEPIEFMDMLRDAHFPCLIHHPIMHHSPHTGIPEPPPDDNRSMPYTPRTAEGNRSRKPAESQEFTAFHP
ncbi:hypothetical protein C8R45DRAFT_1094877 [Mycena sanguinolenta]|nr:hypothetical protein C8R45DRAFT_1094877 [Mycena sanguinolenta]